MKSAIPLGAAGRRSICTSTTRTYRPDLRHSASRPLAGVVDNGAVVHLTTQYLYDTPNLAVSSISGAMSQAGRPFAHGFELYFDRATLAFEFANLGGRGHVAMPLSVVLPDGTVTQPDLGSGDPVDAFTQEITVAADAIASGHEPDRLSGKLARQALSLCLAEIESVKTKAIVTLV